MQSSIIIVWSVLVSALIASASEKVLNAGTCDEAPKILNSFGHRVASCSDEFGFPLIKYAARVKITKCDSIKDVMTQFAYSVVDCIEKDKYTMFRVDGNFNWNEGRTACMVIGGDLASIRNIDQFLTADSLYRTSPLSSSGVMLPLIGINDQAQEGVYRWSDDGSIVDYAKWGAGEPNEGRQANCGSWINSPLTNKNFISIGYNDVSCDQRDSAICKVMV